MTIWVVLLFFAIFFGLYLPFTFFQATLGIFLGKFRTEEKSWPSEGGYQIEYLRTIGIFHELSVSDLWRVTNYKIQPTKKGGNFNNEIIIVGTKWIKSMKPVRKYQSKVQIEIANVECVRLNFFFFIKGGEDVSVWGFKKNNK